MLLSAEGNHHEGSVGHRFHPLVGRGDPTGPGGGEPLVARTSRTKPQSRGAHSVRASHASISVPGVEFHQSDQLRDGLPCRMLKAFSRGAWCGARRSAARGRRPGVDAFRRPRSSKHREKRLAKRACLVGQLKVHQQAGGRHCRRGTVTPQPSRTKPQPLPAAGLVSTTVWKPTSRP